MTVHEAHRSHRIGWLRASVLGANDGIVSTSSLIIGVAAANAAQNDIILAGLAGLVAGAMSMAAGEYVSVSSQADTENADLALERKSLEENLEFERDELAKIYEERGLTSDLAGQVAEQLMLHDALGAHARDEIGIIEGSKARPIQAALSSAAKIAFSLKDFRVSRLRYPASTRTEKNLATASSTPRAISTDLSFSKISSSIIPLAIHESGNEK